MFDIISIISSDFLSALIGAMVGCIFGSIYKYHFELWFKFHKRKCDIVYLGDVTTIDFLKKNIPYSFDLSVIRVGDEIYCGITFDNICDLDFVSLWTDCYFNYYITCQGKRKKKYYRKRIVSYDNENTLIVLDECRRHFASFMVIKNKILKVVEFVKSFFYKIRHYLFFKKNITKFRYDDDERCLVDLSSNKVVGEFASFSLAKHHIENNYKSE